MLNFNHDHVFNQKQRIPFWKKLLSSLSFSDNFGGDDDDAEKTFKLILRIQNNRAYLNKKIHQILIDQEIEQFNADDGPSFNLVRKQISLEPLAAAFENPFGGSSTLSMIRSQLSDLNTREFVLCIKTYDIQRGT